MKMLGITRQSLHIRPRLVSRENLKNSNGKLSSKLLDYLESKYKLMPWQMLSLRVVKSKGFLGNRPAFFIRIYDHKTAAKNGVYIKAYYDLDKRPDLILYKGYILENDFIYISKCDTGVAHQNS
jgi:hypothetical protein